MRAGRILNRDPSGDETGSTRFDWLTIMRQRRDFRERQMQPNGIDYIANKVALHTATYVQINNKINLINNLVAHCAILC